VELLDQNEGWAIKVMKKKIRKNESRWEKWPPKMYK
jgi:hypothetical protein